MSCLVCRRSTGALYRLPGTTGPEIRCLRHALLARPVRLRALQIAAVVGTTLFIINQLDVVLRGHFSGVLLCKVVLTYTVPFLVSVYSALSVSKVATASANPPVGSTRDS